ncbi:hypothetical protein [Bacillus wiedmannii]|uniref:hypothetical protein n=1 Tax=Bacillus wiedmannii TaxID=1890302 RepID=UPI0015CF5CD0|nr:hypothetical protein [Bacillus wiedmannii]
MKEFKVTFFFEKEHSRSILVDRKNRNEIIQEIEQSNWFGNDETRINLVNVTAYKIREM